MSRSFARLATVALLAVGAALAGAPSPAGAALPINLPILTPKPAAPPPVAPVAAPVAADPPNGVAVGTMVMVHAGGWAGHDANAQQILMQTPGELLRARGWRVVSIDYNEGTAGLQDVLNTVGAELSRASGAGPVCIYGESSGAHLALVAAARLRAVDCVIGLGTPTDLTLYGTEAAATTDGRLRLVAHQITRFFGASPAEIAPWDLISLAPTIHADVTLLHEADDEVVSALHAQRFKAARPTTLLTELQAGDTSDPATKFVHGTLSDAGRGQYAAAVGSLADRAVAASDAERSAERTGCTGVSRSFAELGLTGLRTALRCLARKDAQARRGGVGGWKRTSVTMRGEVNASRIWTSLRRTKSGRRAIAAAAKRRVRVTVRSGDRSRVVLRATR